jgi:hypothetical protein
MASEWRHYIDVEAHLNTINANGAALDRHGEQFAPCACRVAREENNDARAACGFLGAADEKR